MKKYLILLICLLFISCESYIIKNEKIYNMEIRIKVNENLDQSSQIYHIYFENNDLKNKSFGIDLTNITDFNNVELFPGIYNIYCYGLIEKTSTTKKVFSYKIIRQAKISSNVSIIIDLIKLFPDFSVSNIDGNYGLIISMKDIHDIFTVSSLSIKQGTDKIRAVDFYFDKVKYCNYANIPFYQNGEWLMNISYDLKTKTDEAVLEKDGLKISTSNFSSIIIGNF